MYSTKIRDLLTPFFPAQPKILLSLKELDLLDIKKKKDFLSERCK